MIFAPSRFINSHTDKMAIAMQGCQFRSNSHGMRIDGSLKILIPSQRQDTDREMGTWEATKWSLFHNLEITSTHKISTPH